MTIHDKIKRSWCYRILASLIVGKLIDKKTWKYTCASQSAKGIIKYGHNIDSCPKDKFDWKIMAIEEAVDLFVYREKNKQK